MKITNRQLNLLQMAWEVEGSHPEYHREQKARLLAQWPSLYIALIGIFGLPGVKIIKGKAKITHATPQTIKGRARIIHKTK